MSIPAANPAIVSTDPAAPVANVIVSVATIPAAVKVSALAAILWLATDKPWIVSTPAPKVIASAPAPPVIVLFPAPALIVSFPAPPLIISFPEPAVIVSSPVLPLIVNPSVCADRTRVVLAPVAIVIVSTLTKLASVAKVWFPVIFNISLPSPPSIISSFAAPAVVALIISSPAPALTVVTVAAVLETVIVSIPFPLLIVRALAAAAALIVSFAAPVVTTRPAAVAADTVILEPLNPLVLLTVILFNVAFVAARVNAESEPLTVNSWISLRFVKVNGPLTLLNITFSILVKSAFPPVVVLRLREETKVPETVNVSIPSSPLIDEPLKLS